ncbi:tRNA1(Val) A37 N6-methylase TrmN6 [Marinitoga hydrogenitolerans DSM 16785]|uniref:tRNA1(Val) A37 N6-methylase TrmN6 n=1 Tax=Marinitoga hydrogenitolerans (strain DSM 16785 / JCM 12826 / AT1271) TaxID=1122195 RepID=A0A1M4TIS7_MARH1|nr:methyltransferase domain-containing protein [Marinitoga hydrogenitolerans]SHE44370.1 tRNA1(Val) A37 N6-methylase TrmN6 [Marinitoga hydrogenitolerans DSM 16785]
MNLDKIFRELDLKSPNKFHSPTHGTTFLIEISKLLKGEKKILELGSGIGSVSLSLAKIYSNIEIIGFELQREPYEYSLENLKNNKLEKRVRFINDDIENISKYIECESIDCIITNPPHYSSKSLISPYEERKVARTFDKENLEKFFKAAKYALKNKKRFIFVYHPVHFMSFLDLAKKHKFMLQEMYLAYGKKHTECQLIGGILRKNGGENLKIHPPVFLKNSNDLKEEKDAYNI